MFRARRPARVVNRRAAGRVVGQRPRAATRAPVRRRATPATTTRTVIRTTGKPRQQQPRAAAKRMARVSNTPRVPQGPPISLSAFSEQPVPRMLSEARSMLCKGGFARQFGTSYGQLVDAAGSYPDSAFSPPIGPLPAGAITVAAPYPTTFVFMPSNSPILYRVYAPIVARTPISGRFGYTVIGMVYEDYGSLALGTNNDYTAALKGATIDETEANGKIVDLSTATHSFRIRNVTAAIATGGTIRQLRQATGITCPLYASTLSAVLYGTDNTYYRKGVCYGPVGTAAMSRFTRILENVNNSTNFVASNGKQYTEPFEGNCTAVDAIKASEFRRESKISADSAAALRAAYGSALPGFASALAVDIALPLISLRSGLLEGDPPPPPVSYALTWTQSELRQNMLTGQAFPLDPWPNFGNIGYTQDPLALIGLKMRYPASGGETYVLEHVDPATPAQDGLCFFNPPSTDDTGTTDPAVPTSGFTPVGAGWEDIDVQNLLTTDTKALVGLRFRDNVSDTVYMILVANKSTVEAVVDGPLVAAPPLSLNFDDSNPDPFTADLIEPRFTPFLMVLESIPGPSGREEDSTAAAYINTYEITARSQQFAHFTPGSLLANNQKPQPSAPIALRRAKDAEERKGSWLTRITRNIYRGAATAGRFAYQHRAEIGALASTLM